MHPEKIELNGQPFFYRSSGEGPCVVLLHGFGEDGAIWHNQWHHLDGYRLLIPDLPGSGLSNAVPDMSMEGLATVIYNLLQQENVDRCTLIGHSMGGYIALAFLEMYPEKVAALGLFHSSALADSDAKKETREKGIAFIEKNGALLFLQTTIPNLYAPETKEKRNGLVQTHIEGVKEASGAALVAYYRAMMARPDRTKLLQQNKIPFLFVLGKHDTAVPLADGLAQAHMPQIAQVGLLELSGHMGMVEQPDQSNKLLQDFLALQPVPNRT
jgi:pimeloyl-ACP methyl ester carboxylesterase